MASLILTPIFEFGKSVSLSRWYIVDDVVMGGRSAGSLHINDEGHGVFSGDVSLENYGGFSSVRYVPDNKLDYSFNQFVLRVKGDGKKYQFRAKSSRYDRHSYISEFETTGEWQTITIDCSEMYPSFRGRRLRMSNYSGQSLEEIAFLIGNKKEESFELQIASVSIQ